MKRIERNTYNSIKRNTTADTINVEIPVEYSHEARQAIHEYLTINGMRVTGINWNSIQECYCIHWEPARTETAEAIRSQQENADIDDVTKGMEYSDWTWNGYRKPAEAPTTAPAAEADQQPTDTENAPQAAPAAPQVDPITAATIASISAQAPAHTVTVTWASGTRAAYSATMLDMLRTDPAALDIQDDSTGEIIYIKPDSTEAATEAAEEQTTTDEQNEEENTMSNTIERYDYMEHMTADVIDAIRERYTPDEIRERLDDDRDDFAQELNDDLWIDDSVTGNASGSYYCNAWRAEDAIAHNWDLIADMIDELDEDDDTDDTDAISA